MGFISGGGATGQGGWLPFCPSVRGLRVTRMPFSFKMRKHVKVHFSHQSIMPLNHLMKFILQCLFG